MTRTARVSPSFPFHLANDGGIVIMIIIIVVVITIRIILEQEYSVLRHLHIFGNRAFTSISSLDELRRNI